MIGPNDDPAENKLDTSEDNIEAESGELSREQVIENRTQQLLDTIDQDSEWGGDIFNIQEDLAAEGFTKEEVDKIFGPIYEKNNIRPEDVQKAMGRLDRNNKDAIQYWVVIPTNNENKWLRIGYTSPANSKLRANFTTNSKEYYQDMIKDFEYNLSKGGSVGEILGEPFVLPENIEDIGKDFDHLLSLERQQINIDSFVNKFPEEKREQVLAKVLEIANISETDLEAQKADASSKMDMRRTKTGYSTGIPVGSTNKKFVVLASGLKEDGSTNYLYQIRKDV